jgi:hypothetical protein
MGRSSRWPVPCLSLALLLGVSSGVMAQAPVTLPDAGSHLRIQTSDGAMYEGRLIASGLDSLRIEPRASRSSSASASSGFAVSELEEVWVRRSRVGKGAGIGAVVGGIGGGFFVGWLCAELDSDPAFNSCAGPVAGGVLVGGLGGAVLGALFGAAASSWKLTYSASPGSSGPSGGLVVRIPH